MKTEEIEAERFRLSAEVRRLQGDPAVIRAMNELIAFSREYPEPRRITISDRDREILMGSSIIDDRKLDWWTFDLLRLIAKSDPEHKAALRREFPSFVEAYEEWFNNPMPEKEMPQL